MSNYQHVIVKAKPRPMSELIDDKNPDATTPAQAAINAETILAEAAPDLRDALEALIIAVMNNEVTHKEMTQAISALNKCRV